jgi:thiamine biosynthesis lipoprotein
MRGLHASSFLLAVFFLFLPATANAARVDETRALMGTAVQVSAEGASEASLRAAVGEAFAEMARLSAMMSHYEATSVVSEIGRAAGRHPVAVPPELMQVLRMAQAVSRGTQGAFDATIGALSGWRFRPDDPRLPAAAEIERQRALVDYRHLVLDERKGTAFLEKRGMRLDLGGIAKLYILRAGLARLEGRSERALVNGGGDVAAWGARDATPWRVGIRDPRAPAKLLGVVELTRGFVASSGDYERYFVREGVRYSHILDPRTGRPAHGPRGVTLVSKRLEDVAGYGVAIMVLGAGEAKRLARERPGLDALVVDEHGELWTSPGMRKRFGAR